MNCCAECFGDRGLRRNIIPSRTTQLGQCSYCRTDNTLVLPPVQLAEYFELLASSYQHGDNGRLLIQWFREDWGMFGHPSMDDSKAKDLLAEILNDGEIVRETFLPMSYSNVDQVGEWEKLREELMYRNRFFPEVDINLERLELLLSPLTLDSDEIPSLWYRARIQTTEIPFGLAEMGAPPRGIASHGRANPAGIPYLYLGSSRDTAITEVRPHPGEMTCVAKFTTPNDIRVVDLRNPKTMVSPFMLEDASDIARMRSDLPFLERLGEELTRPVVPHAAAVDYTPSQYLCEFIKKCGYDGVIYRSSVSDGMNLALFEPARAKCNTVTPYKVVRVSVNVEAAGL